MILAGIDEAGYGPVLGPLVVGCCAFEVAHETAGADDANVPCIWKKLKKVVSKNRSRSGRKLHVNDSKQVYSPGIGLKELERSVLALLATLSSDSCRSLDDFLSRVASHAVADLSEYIWYRPDAAERFPIEQELTPIQLFANALRAEMDRNSTRCVHLAARVVPEKQLNRLLDQTRNKGAALFGLSAIHLDYLLRTFGDRNLVIFCDRQGGREHYGHLLRQMFETWSLEILFEKEGHCEYRLIDGVKVVRIIFCEKAEGQCLSVAAASMLSKYLREVLMRRFNAYWRKLLPDVEPTAGYYNDGLRFLSDISTKRHELGIPDGDLIRSR